MQNMLLIMFALWNRADHYIFALWFFPSSFFFSSPNLSRRRLDVHFHQFRIQVWNVLHAARWKCKTQKSPSAHHSTTLSDYIFVTKALIGNQKKSFKQRYLPHMSLQYDELRLPPTAEIRWRVWRIPANFNGFLQRASMLALQALY